MSPGEVTPMTGLGAPTAGPQDRSSLRDDVVELARSLPGELSRLTVRSGDRAIEVEWARPTTPAGRLVRADDPAGREEPTGAAELPEGSRAVRAPLVGTYYAAPVPGADPFVQVGDEVGAGQTLGIVEAMKLMNPITADEAGVVAEIRVSDAESVEYDQVLMVLRPVEER